MPGLPVLQDGFVSHGWSLAANGGFATGSATYGVAAAWTPASEAVQVSGGLGAVHRDEANITATTGGVRVAMPLRTPWTRRPSSRFGLTAFGGAGSSVRSGEGTVQVPLGVGLGYRRRLGETRALSLFATPFYSWWRRTGDVPADVLATTPDAPTDSNLFRASFGASAILTARLAIAAGVEVGGTAEAGAPGATGSIGGVGLAFRF